MELGENSRSVVCFVCYQNLKYGMFQDSSNFLLFHYDLQGDKLRVGQIDPKRNHFSNESVNGVLSKLLYSDAIASFCKKIEYSNQFLCQVPEFENVKKEQVDDLVDAIEKKAGPNESPCCLL